MKKKLISLGIGLLAFGLMSQSTLMAQNKIGVVDTQEILGSLKETQEINKKLQLKQNEMVKHLKELQDSVISARTDFDKNIKDSPVLKEVLKKAAEKGIQDLEFQLQNKQANSQKELYELQNTLLEPVIEKIRVASENVRIKNGLEILLDKSAGIVVAFDDKFDLTSAVLEEMIKMKTTGSK